MPLLTFRLASALLLLAASMAALPANAVPIPVSNPSFENPPLADGGFIQSAPPGWGPSGGVFNPVAGVHMPAGATATDGDQVAFAAQNSVISQVLGATLQAGSTYTLLVDVGDRLDTSLSDYAVGLYAGGNLLVEDFGTLSPVSDFLTSQITYAATSTDPFLGQALEIRLTGSTTPSTQVLFDNVRLDVGVPEPNPALLVAAGLMAVFGASARLGERKAAGTEADLT